MSKVDENRRPVISLGSCNRCHGDMRFAQDIYGVYDECLQCGNTVELPKPKRYSHMRDGVTGSQDAAG